jgi:hypothetical protein
MSDEPKALVPIGRQLYNRLCWQAAAQNKSVEALVAQLCDENVVTLPEAVDVTAYIAFGGKRCPYCNHDKIDSSALHVADGVVQRRVVCRDCLAKWHDVFSLTSIGILDDNGVVVATLPDSRIKSDASADARPG